MNRYEVGKAIGEGAFGCVYLATKKSTGEKRAIKRMKGSFSWDGVVKLRELQSILRLPAHANIVQLHEIIREKDDMAYFVFEYMPSGTLQDLLQWRKKSGQPLPDMHVRCYLQQILMGLKHMHDHGIIHRDLKPENILLNGPICKIADFSLARRLDENSPCTSYISTRWYRAPEILLQSRKYSSPVDLFAMGCIAAEFYALKPLFPGLDEFDQLRHIFRKLGTPRMQLWQEGAALLDAFSIQDWEEPKVPPYAFLEKFLRGKQRIDSINFDDTVVDFLLRQLALDPANRMTATQALQHNYFLGIDASVLTADHVHAMTPALQPTTTGTDELPIACKTSDASSFSSHTTPTSSKQFSKMNQAKHLVTVSPPPDSVLRESNQLPTNAAKQMPNNKRLAVANRHLSSYLSPAAAAASISNPYMTKNSNNRQP